jgi:uncharacterized membrane protein YphA (DoxX/SURF4 family)
MAVKHHSGGVDFGLLIVRIVVGAYIALAGLGKLGIFVKNDPTAAAGAGTQPATQPDQPVVGFQWPGFSAMGDGVSNFANGMFKNLTPDWLPSFLATPYGYAIPFLEVIAGVLIILGLITRTISLLTLLMIGSFTYAIYSAAGVWGLVEGAGPFHGNFFILAALILTLFAGPGRVSLDRLFGGKKGAAHNGDEDDELGDESPRF